MRSQRPTSAGFRWGRASLRGAGPDFLVWALADPDGAPLDRLHVVKGWIAADGTPTERVFDVACGSGRPGDPTTDRCPESGASVDLENCSLQSAGAATQLRVAWQDPEFDAARRAFYYARVLETPTCRWSTWDAVSEGTPPRADLRPTIQERAWSSPIHLDPAAAAMP